MISPIFSEFHILMMFFTIISVYLRAPIGMVVGVIHHLNVERSKAYWE